MAHLKECGRAGVRLQHWLDEHGFAVAEVEPTNSRVKVTVARGEWTGTFWLSCRHTNVEQMVFLTRHSIAKAHRRHQREVRP